MKPVFYTLGLGQISLFYCAQWEEYHTGVLRTNENPYWGITELQIFLVILFAAQGKYQFFTCSLRELSRYVTFDKIHGDNTK